MTSGIYEIVNLNDGYMTAYIGSSQNIEARWRDHKSDLRRGIHCNSHLQRAYDKYGSDSFAWGIIEILEQAALVDREQYWLDEYRAVGKVYNLAMVIEAPFQGRKHTDAAKEKVRQSRLGKPTWRGRKHTAEARAKISRALTGRKLDKAWRQKLREARLGKPLSEATKRKLSVVLTGRKHTSETRAKISNAHKGKRHTDEHTRNQAETIAVHYPAFVHCDTGEIIPSGKNLNALCRERGLLQGGMWHLIHGRQYQHRGWRLQDISGLDRVPKPQHYRAYPALVNKELGLEEPPGVNVAAFCRRFDLDPSLMRAVLNGTVISHKGWMPADRDLQTALAEKAAHLAAGKTKPYPAFVHIETGEIIPPGTNAARLCRERDLEKGNMYRVISGKQRQHKGWMLYEQSLTPSQSAPKASLKERE
jgi:group I intron endonuclease